MFEKILIKVVRIYLYTVGPILIIVVGFLVFAFLLVFLLEFSFAPSRSSYKNRLQDVTETRLSSCRLLKKKYSEDVYYGAIFKLSREDFDKVLHAVETDTCFVLKPDMEFNYGILDMLEQKKIDTALVNYKYRSHYYGYTSLFFWRDKRIVVMNGPKIK